MKAIDSQPHLFKIITPIKSDPFRSLLLSHPNQDLIESVIHGLMHGFWPFANMEDPKTMPQGMVLQGQKMPDLDDESVQFLKQQQDAEMLLGWYKDPFGPELIPGMVAQPIFMVLKKGSSKLCLVNDHSAGHNSLNLLIPAEGGYVILDNLSDLTTNIQAEMQ